MKILITALLMLPAIANAHLVPADIDSPELTYLRDEKKDNLAVGMAKFCAGISVPIDVCIARFGKDLITAEAATECVQEVGWAPDFDAAIANMIPVGTKPDGTKLMIFHNYYVADKEYGNHRHDWSEGARDKAGTEYALWRVEQLKQAWSGTSSSTSMGADVSGKYAGGAALKIPGAQADSSVEVKGSGDIKKTEESKGPPPEKIQQTWDEGYEVGKSTPWSTQVIPDILCTKTKEGASCNGGPDPTLTKPEPPKEPVAPSEPAKAPVSGWPETYPMSKPDPAKSTIEASDTSPLEECLRERINKKKETTINYTEPTEEKKSLKQRAEEALDAGVCLVEWYGQEFCTRYYMQKDMVIQPNEILALPEASPEDEFGLIIDFFPDEEAAAEAAAKSTEPAGPEVHPWCADPRATVQERVMLNCPGYAGALDEPELLP